MLQGGESHNPRAGPEELSGWQVPAGQGRFCVVGKHRETFSVHSRGKVLGKVTPVLLSPRHRSRCGLDALLAV